ncbi:MAG: phosphoribosylamine--glycine ligase [Spirochaetes bacterium]|nr:phosphoribosylamine--glycine ligase [Spirochaetota bacterium]
MKVLVVGGGGREHAIAWMLNKSNLVDTLYWTPANGGCEDLCENPGIAADDTESLLRFAKGESIDLTVVGPEVPLVRGITDVFNAEGLCVFGPSKQGAMIEGSKGYAKALMKRRGIPTADFREFTDRASAASFLENKTPPYVLKADGLAAGKGVIVAFSQQEAETALCDMFDRKVFGESGSRVVVEEFLEGEEATVLALTDGKTIVPLISSQDHKAAYDDDKGPNTGGMGAIAPAPVVTDTVMGRVMDRILVPLVEELSSLDIDYRGVVYAGLMIKDADPYVVEFNCRFGDPEAEAVFPLMHSDLCDLILRTVRCELNGVRLDWKDAFCCDVVLASGGYPGKYKNGMPVTGVEKAEAMEEIAVFHAGTKLEGDTLLTNGGRVLNIAGTGRTLREAIDTAYRGVDAIRFEGAHCRRDIGHHALKYVT